jgi:hypothetical protein
MSFTLNSLSSSGRARESVAIVSASESCQYLTYEWLPPIAAELSADEEQQMVNAPLRLIFQMGQ